jgi:predicted metalloprotease with PDZ domain
MYDEFYLKSPNSSYYLRGRGYQTEDVERIVSQISGTDFSDFFKRHVRSVEVLPYDEALGYAGLRLVKTQAKEPFDAGLSIDFEDRNGIIENVRNGSPAEDAGLSAGDEIVSLAGREVTKAWLKTLARYKTGDSIPITVKRDRRTIKTNIVLRDPERFEYRIEDKRQARRHARTKNIENGVAKRNTDLRNNHFKRSRRDLEAHRQTTNQLTVDLDVRIAVGHDLVSLHKSHFRIVSRHPLTNVAVYSRPSISSVNGCGFQVAR